MRSFALPVDRPAKGLDRDTARLMLFGMTTIELACEICGTLRHVQVEGIVSRDIVTVPGAAPEAK